MSLLFALLAAAIAILQLLGDLQLSDMASVHLTLTWGIFLLASCITSQRTSVINIATPDFSSFKAPEDSDKES